MTGDRDDDPTEPAWHERTSTLVWASVAGLVALWIAYIAISFIARQFSGPDEVPQYFLDPAETSSQSFTSTTTTSPSYSSTSPPQTTDIVPGDTTSSSSSTEPNATTRRSTSTSNDDSTSTSRRPRFNETRRPFLNP